MEEQKVTTEKPKNPGRVEWGRKLGKLAKQKKIKTEPVNRPTVVHDNYYTYGGVAVGIALTAICVYKYSFNRTKPQATTFKLETSKERTLAIFNYLNEYPTDQRYY